MPRAVRGFFELADSGTLFLDEINSMDINMQSKILRVLEEKKSDESAAKRMLLLMCALSPPSMRSRKSFSIKEKVRTDLYYRLSLYRLPSRPCASAKSDIPFLTDYFINYFNKTMHRNILGITEDALDVLRNYSWAGNVRELKKHHRRMLQYCR